MELNFDIRGNLRPYEKTTVSRQDFKELFVNSFDTNSSQHALFQRYEKYTQDFIEKVTGDFQQWINGSFVTNKSNPNDIDLINLVDHRIVEAKESLIREEFIRDSINNRYGIDAYLVILYPENHKLYNWTKSDLVHWYNWFTKSRMDRKRRRHPKGFVEIKFGE